MTVSEFLSKMKYSVPVLVSICDESGFMCVRYKAKELGMLNANFGNFEINYIRIEPNYKSPDGHIGKTHPFLICLEVTRKPKTNGDRIRAMSDEELARLFDKTFMSNDAACNYCGNNYPDSFLCEEISCEEGFLKWLKEEVSEDGRR